LRTSNAAIVTEIILSPNTASHIRESRRGLYLIPYAET
jgi:hypothetical protein